MFNIFRAWEDLPPHIVHLRKSLKEALVVALGVALSVLVVSLVV